MSLPETIRRLCRLFIFSQGMRTRVYPLGAASVQLTSGAGAYNPGNWFELIAANTIAQDFWLEAVALENLGAVQDYIVCVGVGGAGAEVSVAEAPLNGTDDTGRYVPITPAIRVPANARVAAQSMDSVGANTVRARVVVSLNK